MPQLKPLSRMPGPRGLPYLGVALSLRREPWLGLERLTRKYGPLVRLTILGRKAVIVADPEALKRVLSEETEIFYKKRPTEAVRAFNPDDLFVARGGADWKEKRAAHAMTGASDEMFAKAGERCARHTAEFIAGLPQTFDASEHLMRLGVDLLSIIIFGKALSEESHVGFEWQSRTANARMQREATSKKPLGPLSADELPKDEEWRALLARAYESCSETSCVASELKRRGLDAKSAARYISGTYLGGGVSVPSTLINVLFHLSQALEVAADCQRRLRAGNPAPSELPRWLPLEGILRESMRVTAPVPLFVRAVSSETELGGYRITPRVGLLLSIWGMQRDPNHWKNPEVFDPARWDQATLDANPYGSPWFAPFGWGPRACVGGEFALVALRNALATILGEGSVVLEPGQTYVPELFMGVRLARGLRGKRVAADLKRAG